MIPRYHTPIVGRDGELAEIAKRLADARAVTIVGTGGIGKTRLAVEAASASPDARDDAAWFVDLAPIADPLLVPSAIASAVGLELAPNVELREALIAALRSERGLIVLDNCEHVVAMCAEIVAAIARECPQLRVLATGREPLGIESESVFRLDGLDDETSAELFVMHARTVDPDLSTQGRNAELIRDICKRLDGIALAIELAAACVRQMPLGQLRSRLDGRFRLVAKHQDAPLARHQTIQALIDWSYDLLLPRQRLVFVRASALSGSFSREAAIAVATAGSDLEPAGVAGDLNELVKKSMLVDDIDGRLRMLESIRSFAFEHLKSRGEEGRLRAAHLTFFLGLAGEAASALGRDSEEAWLARYAPDLDNFRAALDWAVVHDQSRAGLLAYRLSEFWEFVNLASEGMRRSEAILAALRHPGEPEAIGVLLAVAKTALAARIYRRSLEAADRALALAERIHDAAAVAEALRIAGRSRYLLGIEADRSLSELRKALFHIRAQGDSFTTARAMRDYGSALAQTDPEEGRRLLLEGLSLARTIDWPRLTIHIEINVAEREFRSGNPVAAVERALSVIGQLRKRRSPVQLGHALTNLSSYLAVAGQYDAALEAAREAIEIGRTHDAQNYVVLPLQASAIVLAERDRADVAANLLGFVDAFYDRYAMKREATEAMVQHRLLTVLRKHFDAAPLERHIAAGRALTDGEAVALALGEPRAVSPSKSR